MSTRRAAILIPVASFLVTFALSWPASRPGYSPTPATPAAILATGKESRWHFRYPGPDGVVGTADDVASQGDLHVPMGTDLDLILRSDDYLYTFSVPDLGLRGMAIPELTSTIPVRADRPGTFPIAADEMCGRPMPHEPLHLVVEPLPDFLAWLGTIRRQMR
jgi:cytochrome c oxidase subunit 2